MIWNPQALGPLDIPMVVEADGTANVLETAQENAEAIDVILRAHGAVLLRGFALSGEETLGKLFECLWAAPLAYVYRSTPRTNVGKGIYTATEYPKNQELPMHNENSYQRDWPTRIGFQCVVPPETGGQTPLANIVRVTSRIGPDIVSTFRERKVCYVRNYSEFIDLPWQTVFQTDSKDDVEQYCRENDISFEWTDDGLRTKQICQGTSTHPDSGEEIWFNQAQLFHVSSLGPEMAASMVDTFGEDGLPRNTYFGDGEPIPDDIIARINQAFDQEKVLFDWQRDDILLLDNMRIAHGRKSFTGSRRVLVSMGRPYSLLKSDVTSNDTVKT